MNDPILAPSLLAGDPAAVGESADIVAGLGLEWLHIDIMDGHFVPNLSFGPGLLAALRRRGSKLFFDTHLMLSSRIATSIRSRRPAPAGSPSTSSRPTTTPRRCAPSARTDAGPGSPSIPAPPRRPWSPCSGRSTWCWSMTVQPGFGGQAFREDVLPEDRSAGPLAGGRTARFSDRGRRGDRARHCRAVPRKGRRHVRGRHLVFAASDKAAFAASFAAL
jgi:ribulose-phosphate 3-epimerase